LWEKFHESFTDRWSNVWVCGGGGGGGGGGLVSQQWMCMNHIVNSGLSLLHSICPHYLINGIILKKVIGHNFFSLQLSFQTFLTLRRTEQDGIKKIYWSSFKVPLFLSDFNETWIFSIDFRKMVKYQISWRIRLLGAVFFHSDRWMAGQTDLHDKSS
jgi:hypothetical protein